MDMGLGMKWSQISIDTFRWKKGNNFVVSFIEDLEIFRVPYGFGDRKFGGRRFCSRQFKGHQNQSALAIAIDSFRNNTLILHLHVHLHINSFNIIMKCIMQRTTET